MAIATTAKQPAQPANGGVRYEEFSLGEIREMGVTVAWLVELAKDVGSKDKKIGEVSHPLPGETQENHKQRFLDTVARAEQLYQELVSELPSIYEDIRDGEPVEVTPFLENMLGAPSFVNDLRVKNKILLELIEGLRGADYAWKAGVSDAEFLAQAEASRKAKTKERTPPRWSRGLAALLDQGAFPPEPQLTDFEKRVRDAFLEMREDLVNTGLRNNKFINWTLTKRHRGVALKGETVETIHRALVIQQGSLGFLPFEQPGIETAPTKVRVEGVDLQTPHALEELEERLFITEAEARQHSLDRGHNPLYIGLGTLHWTPSDDKTGQVRHAPLILLPVRLERATVNDPFRVLYTGDPLEENGPLRKRLYDEFGIELPGLEFDMQPAEYFDEVVDTFQNEPNFRVRTNECVMDHFTSGIQMYDDLNPELWDKTKVPWKDVVTTALMGGGFHESAGIVPPGERIDDYIDPSRQISIFGCDASQQEVLLHAGQGHNAVLIGPPGSGKSWAIAEALAQAVWQGEKVLFVAEKPAALEVVKRRMEMMGLADLILYLPRHDTSRKQVAEELRQTVELGEPAPIDPEPAVKRYKNVCGKLNALCDALKQEVGETGMNPHELAGRILDLGEQPITFEGDPTADWSAAEFKSHLQNARILQELLCSKGLPADNPFYGALVSEISPEEEVRVKADLSQAIQTLDALRTEVAKLWELSGLSKPVHEQDQLFEMLAALDDFHDTEGAEILGIKDLSSSDWSTQKTEVETALNAGKELKEAKDLFGKHFKDDIWEKDSDELYKAHQAYEGMWFKRLFMPGFYRARRSFRELQLETAPKYWFGGRLKALKEITEAQAGKHELEGREDLCKETFGELWQGADDTDYDKLERTAEFAENFRANFSKFEIFQKVVQTIQTRRALDLEGVDVTSQLKICKESSATYNNARQALLTRLVFDSERAKERLFDPSLADQKAVFTNWENEHNRLLDLVVVNRQIDDLNGTGLEFLGSAARDLKEDAPRLASSLEQCWLVGQMNQAREADPELEQFDPDERAALVDEFKIAEREMRDANAQALMRMHWEGIPRINTGGQVGIVADQLRKQRGHIEIPEFLESAGTPLLAIKPILFMTPRTVAEFLPRKFHIRRYITDEASQQEIVRILGSMLRTDVTMVCGDPQQMRPSRFFKRASKSETVGKSALDQFVEMGATQFMLSGSYRPKDPSLMQCSNVLFYDGKLRVFPSPFREAKNVGLLYNHEALPYDGKGINRAEAEKVAKAVMEHAKNDSDLSLAVVALSQDQASTIAKAIERMRKNSRDRRVTHFFNNHPAEPFVVRNLENIQGDERDVIMVSTAYGKNATGQFRMHFGRVNQPEGDKGLNVLFTRAKLRTEIFTAIDPAEMDLRKVKSDGVRALKAYLKYAKNGELEVPKEQYQPEPSAFDHYLAKTLEEKGQKVKLHVGSAECYVNIAVVDPEHPDRYILGIVTDDKQFQTARSARERECINPDVLTSLGWNVYRAWSLAFLDDAERGSQEEVEKLLEAIKTAQAGQYPTDTEFGRLKPKVIPRNTEPGQIRKITGEQYEVTKLKTRARSLANKSTDDVEEWVRQIVETEFPIHVREIASRIRTAVSIKDFNAAEERLVEGAIDEVTDEYGDYYREGDFVYKYEQTIIARDRMTRGSQKRIEYVAPEEIHEALSFVVEHAVNIHREEAIAECAYFLGWKSVPTKAPEVIGPVIDSMINDGTFEQDRRSNLSLVE